MNYAGRVQRLQAILRRKRLDAILISQPQNRRYLCGYAANDHSIDESAGSLLVSARGENSLLTDFRYEIQARREVNSATVVLYPRGLTSLLKKMAPELGLKRIGFESHYMLHKSALKLMETCREVDVEWLPTSDLVEKMRLIKEQPEIDILRRSVRLNEQVFQDIMTTIDTGSTELDIAMSIENRMRSLGAESASFDTIVATGSNSALPHAVPGKRFIEPDRPLMIDMGLVLDGYCSDMTRTFVIGQVDDRYLEIHRLVRRAQLSAIKLIRPGVTMREVDRAARSIIEDGGYGKNFGHSLGHGVGLAVHEGPRLSSRSRMKLKAGMVLTVEPGIYIPDWGGVRLENMVAVNEDGCELLNRDTTWLDR